jgi:hypothetical protein
MARDRASDEQNIVNALSVLPINTIRAAWAVEVLIQQVD